MIRKISLVLFGAALFATGCKKDFKNEIKPGAPELKKMTTTVGAYQSSQPYNLNVVYFIPSDVGPRPDYERRVSEFLLAAQEFYRQGMVNWGYGDRTFGLLKAPLTNRVKINVVNGQYPMASYPHSAGTQIKNEVDAWFAANPGNKFSDHTLIITAIPTKTTDVPYYASRGLTFMYDNEQFDYQTINQNTEQGNDTKYFMGVFLHELGHGFGLIHDAFGKTQENNPSYGTSIMGMGTTTYGFYPTNLTKASCAWLNNTQLFATSAKPANYFYTGANGFEVTSINTSFVNGKVQFSGTYTVNAPANAITCLFNPDDGYNQVQGICGDGTSNTFNAYIDTADLHPNYSSPGEYEFVVVALFNNGQTNYKSYRFTIRHGVVHFTVDKTGWTVHASSQYGAYPASLAIDGNENTYWHTDWTPGSVQGDPVQGQAQTFPYFFDIDMGKVNAITGLCFTQHQSLVRTAKTVHIYTRASLSDGWSLDWYGDLANITQDQFATFAQRKNCRYIRIVFYSSYDGQPYIAMPEIEATN